MAAALPLKLPWLKFCLTCTVAQVPSANIKGGGVYCLYCIQPSGGAVGDRCLCSNAGEDANTRHFSVKSENQINVLLIKHLNQSLHRFEIPECK